MYRIRLTRPNIVIVEMVIVKLGKHQLPIECLRLAATSHTASRVLLKHVSKRRLGYNHPGYDHPSVVLISCRRGAFACLGWHEKRSGACFQAVAFSGLLFPSPSRLSQFSAISENQLKEYVRVVSSRYAHVRKSRRSDDVFEPLARVLCSSAAKKRHCQDSSKGGAVETGCSCFTLQAVLLYNTTPIHCTPLRLHPPLMNTQPRRNGTGSIGALEFQTHAVHGDGLQNKSKSQCVCVYIYIYVYAHSLHCTVHIIIITNMLFVFLLFS